MEEVSPEGLAVNRVAHYFEGLDSLLGSLADEDGEVGGVLRQPMDLYIGREILAAVLEDNIAAIYANRAAAQASGAEPAEIAALLEERERLLQWLRDSDDVNVFVTLALASPNQRDDEDDDVCLS